MLGEVSYATAIRGALQSGDPDQIRAVLLDAIGQAIAVQKGIGDDDATITLYIMENFASAIASLALYGKIDQLIHNTAVIARKAPDRSPRVPVR